MPSVAGFSVCLDQEASGFAMGRRGGEVAGCPCATGVAKNLYAGRSLDQLAQSAGASRTRHASLGAVATAGQHLQAWAVIAYGQQPILACAPVAHVHITATPAGPASTGSPTGTAKATRTGLRGAAGTPDAAITPRATLAAAYIN